MKDIRYLNLKFIDEHDHVWKIIEKGVYAYKIERTVIKQGRKHTFKSKVPIHLVKFSNNVLTLIENE